MLSSGRRGCLSSVGLSILLLLLTSFGGSLVIFCLRSLSLIIGCDLQEVARAEKSTGTGWLGLE